MQKNLVRAVRIAPFVVFTAVYLSAAGHGFIKDDYVWILGSRVRNVADLVGLFHAENGFYRPIVALTFAINELVFGINPLGYGVTNVVLALLCGISVISLGWSRAGKI